MLPYSYHKQKFPLVIPKITMRDVEISVIAPLFNEEDSVELLYRKIKKAAVKTGKRFEIIFVDDGSSDNTLNKATKLANQDNSLRLVEFRKNYGQTPAMAAGIDVANGGVLVTMDGDLQNDPDDIPMMVNKLEEGYDLVVGWRYKRQDKYFTRKIPSMIANRLIGAVTGVPIKDNGCSLKVYKAEVIKNSPFYNEMHRFIPALLSLSGVKVAEVKVRHHARQFGQSKYGLSRIYKVLLDLLAIKTILSLAQHPVRWLVKLSLLPFLTSLIIMIVHFDEIASSNIVISSLVILFFSLGVFLISLGIITELVYFTGNFQIRDTSSLSIKKKSDIF
jgi:glycosyltransferase involved in cell wall biosynthesis